MAKDTKKKKDGGLLQKLRGPKQPKTDPELQALLTEVQADASNMRARLKLADYYKKIEDTAHALDQYLTVAETYAEKGFYPKAIAVYKQALQIKPNIIDAYLKLATLYHKLGLMPEVVEQYQKAAVVYEQQGKEREALDIRRMMLDLDPTNVVGRLKLGQRYLEKGFVTEATAEFLRVADVFEKQGKTAELQKLLEGVLDRGLENFDVLYRLVELYRTQGHPELALVRLAKLSGELAGSSSTLELTAEIAEELGKPAVAIRALERASELYLQSGRRDKVGAICRHILELDAANPYAVARVAEIGAAPAPAERRRRAPAEEAPRAEVQPPPAAIQPPRAAPQPPRAAVQPPRAAVAAPPAAPAGPAEEEVVEEEIVIDEIPIEIEEETPEAAASAADETVIEEIVLDELPPTPPLATAAEPEVEEFAVEVGPLPERAAEPVEAAAIDAAPTEAAAVEAAAPEAPAEEIAFDVEPAVEEAPAAEETGPEQIDLTGMSEEEAAARLEEAIDIYLKYNLRDKAIEYLNLALERHRESLPILEKLMVVHRDGGDEAKADELLDRLIDRAQHLDLPDKLEQYLSRKVEYAPDDLAAARRLADFYVVREPDRAVVHLFDIANRCRDLNRVADAEEALGKILELDPENLGARQELLDIYEQSGQIDNAVAELFRLAEQARDAGEAADAEAYGQRILAHRPLDEKAQDELLHLYASTRDAAKETELLRRLVERSAGAGAIDRAIDLSGRLLALDPADVAVRSRLKDLHLERNDAPAAVAQLAEIARLAAENSRHGAAIDAWRETLRLDPANTRAHEGLRDLYLATGDNDGALAEIMTLAKAALDARDLESALRNFNQALEIDPRNESALRRKIGVLRDLDRAPEAVELLFRIALDMERSGETGKAETALRDVLAIEPDSLAAHRALKDLYLNAGVAAKAVAELQHLAAAAEKEGDNDAALTYWGEISGVDPDNLEARQGIVRLHVAAGDIDKAVAELLAVARLQEQRGDRDSAMQTLARALEHVPDNETAGAHLIDLSLETGRVDQAVELLVAAGDRAYDANRLSQARDFFARAVHHQPQAAVAREKLVDVHLALHQNGEAVEQLFELAELRRAAGEAGRVEETYQQILRLDAENARAATALKDYYIAAGRLDAGLDMLFGFVARERQAGDLDRARRHALEMLRLAEDDRRALQALAEMALESGDAGEAADRYLQLATLAEEGRRADDAALWLGKIIAIDSGSEMARHRLKDLLLGAGKQAEAVEQLFALADLAARRNDPDEAKNQFREVLAIEPENEAALELLVNLMIAAGEGGEALGEMFQLAVMAETKGDYQRAERYLAQILALDPANGAALEQLSRIHIAAGDTGQAVRELFQLENAAEQRYDLESALALVDRIRDLDPENLSALGKKAELEEMLGRGDAAVEALLVLADAQINRGLLDDATRALRNAQKLAPREKTVHAKLLGLLADAGEPRPVIDELLRFYGPDIEAGDLATTIETAQRIVDLDPKFERAHRLLADAFRAQGKRVEALDELFVLADLAGAEDRGADVEALLKEALALDETNRHAAEKLAQFYIENDRAAAAVRLLLAFGDALQTSENHVAAREAYERALQLEDGNPDALRKLRDSYLSTADLAEAVDVLFRTVAAADARHEPEKALAALEEIVTHDERNEPAIRALKTRYLQLEQPAKAVQLLFAADRAFGPIWRHDERLSNIEEILEIEPQNRAALRLLADLQKEGEFYGAAVATLARLGDLFETAGDEAEAEAIWREILAVDPQDFAAHDRLADRHRRRGDLDALAEELFAMAELRRVAEDPDGAERLLREATASERHQTAAWERLAELFAATGQVGKQLEVRFHAAEAAATRGEVAEAEAAYQEILAANAENRRAREALINLYVAQQRGADAAGQALVLADRARKEGQVAEAIAWLERTLAYEPINAKARRRLKNLLVEDGQIERAVSQLRLLAEAAEKMEALDGVEDALVEIVQLQPDNLDVRRELIELYERTDQAGKAVVELLELAEQHMAANDRQTALRALEQAAALQPDNEAVARRLKDAYHVAGDKENTVAMLFHLYGIEIAAKKRHAAEAHLREILEIDPANAEAKEKVFDLFKSGVTDEEKIADLLARSEEAREAGDHEGATQALRQILSIDQNNVEARARLAGARGADEASLAAIEEPVADEVFAVQRLDESKAGVDEDIAIEWGAPSDADVIAAEETTPAAQAVEEDVFATPEAELGDEDIDVFGDATPAAEPPGPEAAPAAPVAAEPAEPEESAVEPPAASPSPDDELDRVAEMANQAFAAKFEEPALAEPSVEAPPAERMAAVDRLIEEALSAETPSAAAEPASWVERSGSDDFLAEEPPAPDIERFAADAPADHSEKVELVEGLVSGPDNIYVDNRFAADVTPPPKPAAVELAADEFVAPPAKLAVVEFDVDEFVAPPPKPPAGESRIIEDFRPFTETAADELLPPVAADTAMAGKDLMADLLTELDIGRPTPPAPSAGGHDLLDDIFGTPQQPVKEAGDSLSELLGDLGASEKTAERAADQDIFQAFVSSLPQESRVSGSAQTHFDLGIAFREMDSCDEAIAEFEKALTKDDGALAFSINYELGQCYAGLGKYEMASEYLDSALTEGVDDEQTMLDLTFELAATLKKLGRLERAKKLFMEVDQRSSNYRGAKAEIAECDRQGAKKGDGDDNIGYL